MEKGVRKDWTLESEKLYESLLAICNTFAERQFIMVIRDLMKYDQRTKAGKRAEAQAKLRLATCSDDELNELAKLQFNLLGDKIASTIHGRLEQLKKVQANIRVKGIKRSEIECQ